MNSKDFRNIRKAKKLLKAYETQSDGNRELFPLSREIENRMKTVKKIYGKIHILENVPASGKLAFADTEFEKMISSMLQLINDMDSFIEEGRQDPPDYR